MFKTIILVVVATIVILVVMSLVDGFSTNITENSGNISSLTPEEGMQVTITGEVNHSGTYLVPLATTLGGLLTSAGGATANADPKAYDTTLAVLAKESYYIAPIYDNSNTCAATPIVKVCINSSTKESLDELTAFTSTVALAIVDYRTTNGPFRWLEELKNVAGIGNATFEKCKNYVTLRD